MKNIFKYTFLLGALLTINTSCDKDFDEINTSKTSATAIDPAFQLNNAIINMSYPTRTVLFEMGIVQQLVSPNGGVLAGGGCGHRRVSFQFA